LIAHLDCALLDEVNRLEQPAPSSPAFGGKRKLPYVEPALPLEAPHEAEDDRASGARLRRVRRIIVNILVGALAGSVAVEGRLLINLPPEILPFFLVIIAICLVTVTSGVIGGVTAMIVGALGTWRYLLKPVGSWTIDGDDLYAILGFFLVATVILVTSQLYRWSEQRRQKVALELALREAQHQRLFAREMSHRLKNAMAIVQSIASQTFGRDIAEVPKFEGRLKALADAHNLLNEHVKQPTASVAEVVETAIEPFLDRHDRFRVAGAPMALPDQQVVTLSLALHELGTNAVKYGALSHADGWVSISWADSNGWLELEWKEHDGPPVETPSSKGFGSRLLARSAMGAKMSFEPDGLKCTIRARL
jgi:two-component sensor histidine kinase